MWAFSNFFVSFERIFKLLFVVPCHISRRNHSSCGSLRTDLFGWYGSKWNIEYEVHVERCNDHCHIGWSECWDGRRSWKWQHLYLRYDGGRGWKTSTGRVRVASVRSIDVSPPSRYSPRHFYENNVELKQALDQLQQGYFSPEDPCLFHDVVNSLIGNNGDQSVVPHNLCIHLCHLSFQLHAFGRLWKLY